jgi:ParB family chromosome partitioning protein
MTSGTDKQRKALGKGLSALLPARVLTPSTVTPAAVPSHLPVASIEPNPMQPRTVFQPEGLDELAASIRANGIIQPLIVRHHGQSYQIVAGERRWRAAQLAGIDEVPVVIQEVADSQLLELALIENIQREDLNPIDTALAYERLHRELGISFEEIGQRTGKDRTSVVNTVRLLKLPREVQNLVAEQRLSMGHARAILGVPTIEEQVEIAEKAAAQGLSVRQVESMVQKRTAERSGDSEEREVKQDPNVRAAAEEMQRKLGTRVKIVEANDIRGHIEIQYYSQAELERLFQLIMTVDN